MLISICIPAYKRTDYLRRLLDSIVIQAFRDFEVIVTDDSPDAQVGELVQQYTGKFPLHYHKNQTALGTPENWNEGIRRSKGEWLKLMHDDDWFADADSLQQFADAVQQHANTSFFFCAYTNVYEDSGKTETVRLNNFRRRKLMENTVSLFSSNVIGPPSVTLHRNDKQFWYDKSIRWVVDIDFYIRYLEHHKPVYINKPLVNVGLNAQQVTRTSFRRPEVEVPENFYLLQKVGAKHLENILVYDAWWRLMRNLGIRNGRQIKEFGFNGDVPSAVTSMIKMQRRIPGFMLNTGIFSKMFMFVSYMFNRPRTRP